MSVSLNFFFESVGTSRQAFHGRLDRHLSRMEAFAQLELIVVQARADHPGMALRDLYHMIRPEGIGRDRFERHFSALGYGVGRRRSKSRTTDSSGVVRFENLVAGAELTRVNQVWVSDITYFRVDEAFYYLTFIMDLFSRRIVGHSASISLRTVHTTMPAVRMALATRGARTLEGLIFHSDGGGQFYCGDFLDLTQGAGMRNSMAESVFENPHAERVNGIIKNNYLRHYAPSTFAELTGMTRKAVEKYNLEKPHRAIGMRSPVEFEKLLTGNGLIDKRKKEAKKENFTTSSLNINFGLKVVNTIQA